MERGLREVGEEGSVSTEKYQIVLRATMYPAGATNAMCKTAIIITLLTTLGFSYLEYCRLTTDVGSSFETVCYSGKIILQQQEM